MTSTCLKSHTAIVLQDLNSQLSELLQQAAVELGCAAAGAVLERPRDPTHGDYACSLALRLAKPLGRPPRDIAAELATAVSAHAAVATTTVAGPGFVNIELTAAASAAIVTEVLAAGDNFGQQEANGEHCLLEFVSANPTGPLHIGHGRAAAHGDSLARILRYCGTTVATEYYLNDRGLQIDVLAASLWLRVLQERGELVATPWPSGAYAGDYLVEVAKDYLADAPAGAPVDLASLPATADESAVALVRCVTAALAAADFAAVRHHAVTALTARIKAELASCNVTFDRWQSEQELADSGAIAAGLADFAQRGLTYKQDEAVWFRSSAYGDEKDRVIVRSNGAQTYFAADIAYHLDKCQRCPGILYMLLGADHHGYVARLRAILAAVDLDPARIEVGMLQLVSLVNAGDRIKMSTRAGQYFLLADLVKAIGADAVRLGFVLSKIDVALEFDVARAAATTPDNPVYYLQYAHARSCTLLARWGGDCASLIVTPAALGAEAREVLTELRWFVPTLQTAARERAPHRIAHWLIALASALHSYYDKVPVLGGDDAGRPSRLAVVAATRTALAVGLRLLGVAAPTKM